jgi:hypothetical protein
MKMPGRGPHVYPRLPSAVNRRDFLLLFSSGMDCHRRTSIGIPYMKQSGTRHHGSAALVRRWLAEEDEHRRVRKGRKGEQQREREEKADAEHEGEGEALHVGHETPPAQLTKVVSSLNHAPSLIIQF